MIPCRTCGNYGYIKCPYCHNGYIRCKTCGGSGGYIINGEIYTCNSCNGRGYYRCSCDYGKLTCPDCDGAGHLTCPTCGGSGGPKVRFSSSQNIQCPSCYGRKGYWYQCKRCFGKGKIPEDQ